MSLEAATAIKDLVATNPPGGDPKSQGDDHIRMIKQTLKHQFAGFTEGIQITRKESEINAMLLAGSFGLGGVAIGITETQFVAPDLPNGLYYVNPQNLGNLPGNSGGYALTFDSPNAGNAAVLYIADDLNTFTRIKQAGGWSAWRLQRDAFNSPGQLSYNDTNPAAFLNPYSFGLGVPTFTGAAVANINSPPYGGAGYHGIWNGNNWTNQPPAEAASAVAILRSTAYNADWGVQEFFSISTAKRYQRYWRVATGWTAWETLASIGQAQTWQDLTASRVLATTYVNSTQRPIQIALSGQTNGATGAMAVTTDTGGGGVVISRAAWGAITNGNMPWSMSAVIPAGGTYRLDGTGGLSLWSELR